MKQTNLKTKPVADISINSVGKTNPANVLSITSETQLIIEKLSSFLSTVENKEAFLNNLFFLISQDQSEDTKYIVEFSKQLSKIHSSGMKDKIMELIKTFTV